jgi:hypothetical protein
MKTEQIKKVVKKQKKTKINMTVFTNKNLSERRASF